MSRMSNEEAALAELDILLFRLNRKVERIMAAIDDLNTNLAAVQATITGNVNAAADAIIARIGTPAATEEQIAAAAQAVADLNSSAQAIADKLNAA